MSIKLRLKTISPVNIGNGEILSQFCDYVYDSGFIYYLDYDQIALELSKMPDGDKLIDEFVANVRNQSGGSVRNRFRIKSFLENSGLDYKNFASKKIAVDDEIKEQIQLQIKTGSKPYIPGSSLKGAIRTAIVNYFFTGELEGEIRASKDIKEYIGQDILGKYDEDVLKFLQVSDTMPFEEEDLGIVKFYRFNFKNNSFEIPVVKEVITPGSESSFRICLKAKKNQVDRRFEFLEEGKEDLLFEIINAYTRKNVESELKELKKSRGSELQDVKEFYEGLLDEMSAGSANEAYLRIGSGKTFYDNTVAHKLSKDFLYRIIRSNFKKANPNFFPKTRTVVQYCGENMVPGWIKIEKA